MKILEVIILAVIQGITEFLPISSSGHLVLAERFLGFVKDNITLEIALHFGTLLAVLVVFRRELLALIKNFYKVHRAREIKEVRLFAFIIIGTVPAAIVGLFVKDTIESLFAMPRFTCLMLFLTGVFLLLTKFASKLKPKRLNWFASVIIGLAQALAILPGISRSGWTIGTARLLGIEPKKAYSFSFLLAVPAILGATILELFKLEGNFFQVSNLLPYIIGMVVSGIVGYFSLKILRKIIVMEKFYFFGLYCIFISIFFFIII
ncbi:undecaprenyl-diphosphate phosphatase [bacterium]|nr:undecaprenyl-diphosphate phosphatase [bacterium]